MPEIDLKRLRRLRSRAEGLMSSLVADLSPFRHKEEAHGFRRKPTSESLPNDVNVTTTCSCIMALALSEKLSDFYGLDKKDADLKKIFAKLFSSPWMSSGLPEDNAFTTTLVIRLFGFLVGEGGVPKGFAQDENRSWEPALKFLNFHNFAGRLVNKKDKFSQFLFELLLQGTQKQLAEYVAGRVGGDKVERQVVSELDRLIRTTSFFDSERFSGFILSKEASHILSQPMHFYNVAQLNRILLHDFFADAIAPLVQRSIGAIAREMASRIANFGINEYPPSAAVLYWFIDGVSRAAIRLPEESWTRICTFAAEEFGKQRSLVTAKHAAMMDPIAMAMAACLCARLRRISRDLLLGTTKEHDASLPSTVELENSMLALFAEQTASGIWPKYFPLFHYQDAGSNFCFTFELLEAVLVEFGGHQNRLLEQDAIVAGLEKAVEWCASNRLRCSERSNRGDEKKTVEYDGWNSGGNLETLRHGQPESWATAVVHMFLWELVDVLSRHIQLRLLDSYGASLPTPQSKTVKQLLDIDLWLDHKHTSLKSTLSATIVKTFKLFRGKQAERLRKTPVKKQPLSALLFGPPGTSKTEVAKAIAADLNWPLVEIDPSHFLQDGFQNIYIQAEMIFEDVMDLSGVVVLFDEMDALVQKRDTEKAIDIESRFLTTYMLPKLAKLHDRGQIVFLMATNFQASFDDAIKRAGRFDFLICMGPPTLKAKCDSMHIFFGVDPSPDTKAAGETILKHATNDTWIGDQIALYTYGEFVSFISGLGDASAVKALTEAALRKQLKDDNGSVGLKRDDLERLREVSILKKWKRLRDLDRIEFDETVLADGGIKRPTTIPAVKYVLDRKQTRRQYARSPHKM